MSRRFVRSATVAGVLLLSVVGLQFPPAASQADPTPTGFVATALAEGGRFTYTVPGFALIEDIIDGGGAVSQSVVDPFGATSFASLPYPGENVIAGPGLFTFVTGQPAPGGYPFYARASHPTTPSSEVKDPSGAYQLTATAAQGQATADAVLSGSAGDAEHNGSGGSQATTSVATSGDTLTVTAQTVNEALSLAAGALRIASVRSRSVTTYTTGRPAPETHTELLIEGANAAGTSFGFGPQGMVIGEQNTPVPAADGLVQLNKVLAPAGLALRFVGARPLRGGATADALEIVMHLKAPAPGIPDGIVRLRFGAAASSVNIDSLPPTSGGDAAAIGSGTSSNDPEVPQGAVPTDFAPASEHSTVPPGSADFGATPTPDESQFTVATSQWTAPDGGMTGSQDDASAVAPAGGAVTAPDHEVASMQPIGLPRQLPSQGFVFGMFLFDAAILLASTWLWRRKGVLRS